MKESLYGIYRCVCPLDIHLSRHKKKTKKKNRAAKNAWRTHAFKINYICGDDTILYRQMRLYSYIYI